MEFRGGLVLESIHVSNLLIPLPENMGMLGDVVTQAKLMFKSKEDSCVAAEAASRHLQTIMCYLKCD